MISSHLAAEARYNLNPYGLTTVTGRKTPPPSTLEAASAAAEDEIASRKRVKAEAVRSLMQELRGQGDGQDDAVWMGAAPTWSCITLALGVDGPAGGNVTLALEPTRLELENYRARLHMMWDLTGLSTTGDWGGDSADGQPFCTSHCALEGCPPPLRHTRLTPPPLCACPHSPPPPHHQTASC